MAIQTTTILEGRYALNVKSKRIYAISLDSGGIRYTADSHSTSRTSVFHVGGFHNSTGERSLSVGDIIGCDCRRGDLSSSNDGDRVAYLVIIAYLPHRNQNSGGADTGNGAHLKRRQRKVLTVKFNSHNEYEQNLEEAMKWKIAVCCLLMDVQLNSNTDLTQLQLPARKQLLVLVNPFSGPGHALHIFQRKVVPVFAEAGLAYHLVITERAGHAHQLVQKIELDQWTGIIIVSGDGLIYEVVNGLMARPDWRKAIQMPIGALPGGSGNALSCAICYASGESYLKSHELHAAFVVAKHSVVPMDLVAVDTSSGKRLYSFLSVGWAMMADVDIESDKYRNLGGSRFTLMALIKIAGMKSYRGRLSYLPADKGSTPSAEEGPSGDDAASVKTPLLPPLDSPVPENWTIVDGEFILFGAVYQSHLANNNMMAAEATLNDGLIHLLWVKTGISRMAMTKLLLSFERGHIASNAYTTTATALAFRLEPDPEAPPSIMTVDGESIDYGALQAQVLPSMARVMAIRPH